MALQVIRCHALDRLVDELARRVAADVPSDPFLPIEVVVPSRSMERWLRDSLAERLGVCSNMEFPSPEAWFEQTLRSLRKAEPDLEPWSKEVMTWAMLDVLPELVTRDGFDGLLAYDEEWSGAIGAKQLGLAGKLAELFQRYIQFRPALLQQWCNAGGSFTGPADLKWQGVLGATLWRHFDGLYDPVARFGTAAKQSPTPHLETVRFFGIATLPTAWLPLLDALSANMTVELYLFCPNDGGPAHGGHPLLESLGRTSRAFWQALGRTSHEELAVQVPSPPAGSTALQVLQADIIAARPPTSTALTSADDSIQFHECYGEMRQVEVLRDALLNLFEDHGHLEPRDVVVLTPDITKYAPLIEAVFAQGPGQRRRQDGEPVMGGDGWGPAGAPRVPFRIGDLSIRRENPVADALLRVLEMAAGRFEASQVVELLWVGPVRRKFGLSPEDVITLTEWIHASGIRWGVDARSRTEHGQPGDPQNTWRFGLRRLLLGVVMPDNGAGVLGEDELGQSTFVRPFDAMEGAETRALGRFVDFLNELAAVAEELPRARTMQEWTAVAEEIVERFTATTPAAAWLVHGVQETLAGVADAAQAAKLHRTVKLSAFRDALEGRFELTSSAAYEQSGALTFSALRPGRSFPQRVVCLLGMDEGAFPRTDTTLSFDLLKRSPQDGDPSRGDEDRFILLESILQAGEHLLVVYSARDPRTNSHRPPCVPVAELREVIDRTVAPIDGVRASDWMTAQHGLQAFGESPFISESRRPREAARPWSFDRRLLAGATARAQARPVTDFLADVDLAVTDAVEEVTLDELVRFFKAPTRYLMSRRLKIDLWDNGAAAANREPIELDALERGKLLGELVALNLAGGYPDEVLERLRAEGGLPLGAPGEAVFEAANELALAMLATVGLPPGTIPQPPAELDLQLGSIRLTGSLTNIYEGNLVEFASYSTESASRCVGPWLSLLAWHAQAGTSAGGSILVLPKRSRGNPDPALVGYLAPRDPRGELTRLLELFVIGRSRPIPLLPRASWDFGWQMRSEAEALSWFGGALPTDPNKLSLIRKAFESALDAWQQSNPNIGKRSDLDDVFVARAFDGRNPLVDESLHPVPIDREFARLALQVWGPLFRGRYTTSKVKKWLEGSA